MNVYSARCQPVAESKSQCLKYSEPVQCTC